MSLTQLVYASHPFGFDEAMLNGILLDARRCNERDGITGALIARGDLYLQLLEGPTEKVLATYHRIIVDDRHVQVKLMVQRQVEARMFPGWAMRDDPAKSWIWSIDAVKNGAVERATDEEVLVFFTRLAEIGLVSPR